MIGSVVDNTVLSNFAHIEQPRLLALAFDEIVTVQAVMDELAVGEELKRVPDVDWSWLTITQLTDDELAVAHSLQQSLGRGESACIAVAAARRWLLMTDDRDARRKAREKAVTVSGTLGALMNLVRRKTLSMPEADQFLIVMKQCGYRCPVNSLSDLSPD